jgi:hypothetical protein
MVGDRESTGEQVVEKRNGSLPKAIPPQTTDGCNSGLLFQGVEGFG